LNFSFYQKWIDILLHKTKPADIAGTSLGSGLKHLVVSGVLVGILSGIYTMLAAQQLTAGLGGIGAGLGAAGFVSSLIGTPIAYVVGALIGGGILWVVAKILGGTGSFGNYVGTLSLINAAISGTASAVLIVLGILGAVVGQAIAVSGITGTIGLIVSLYALYLMIRATQAVHNVTAMKAAIIVLVGILLIFVVGAALGAALAALVGAAGSGLL
jgi:hypothetical protein